MSSANRKVIDFTGKVLNEYDAKNRVTELRKLVLEDVNLKKFRNDDVYLLRYLHSCAFDVSASLKRIKAMYDMAVDHPKWFPTSTPLEMKNQILIKDKALLRKADKHGRPVLVIQLGKMDVVNSDPAEQARILEFWIEFVVDNPGLQASGLSVILDMSGYSWRLLRWLTPANVIPAVRKMNIYPLKEVLLHVVNTNFLFNAALKLVWPLLSDKVKAMLKFHFDNWPSLHEYVTPDALPSEYGGTGPDIDFDKSIEDLFANSAIIAESLKHYKLVVKQ